MQEQGNFQVFVRDSTVSVDEWRRAHSVPASELPELNAEQKEVARKLGVSADEYRRNYLAGKYGEERLRDRANRLGRLVQEILGPLGDSYRLRAVLADLGRERWVARIETPGGVPDVEIPREIGDDAIDSDGLWEKERLRRLLLKQLGREEFLPRQ